MRENLSEEELVIFEILTRPAPELTTAERNEVNKSYGRPLYEKKCADLFEHVYENSPKQKPRSVRGSGHTHVAVSKLVQVIMAGRGGFEPPIRYKRIHAFQACAFNRSATCPTLS